MDVVKLLEALRASLSGIESAVGREVAKSLGKRVSEMQEMASAVFEQPSAAGADGAGKLELKKRAAELQRQFEDWSLYEPYVLDGERPCYKLKPGVSAASHSNYLCKTCGDKGIISGLKIAMVLVDGYERGGLFYCPACDSEI